MTRITSCLELNPEMSKLRSLRCKKQRRKAKAEAKAMKRDFYLTFCNKVKDDVYPSLSKCVVEKNYTTDLGDGLRSNKFSKLPNVLKAVKE